MKRLNLLYLALCLCVFISCNSGGGKGDDSALSSEAVDTPFTIHSESELIGGPVAQGRVGDFLLKNNRIRLIIQKARKNAGLNSYGGNIIDADLVRSDGQGQDNFGSIFPLVNVEWTINNRRFEVIKDGKDGGAKILRAYGTIDVYDYLDVDFIADVAEGFVGQKLSYANRFDDRRDPFDIYDDLKGVNPDVVTDYTLMPDTNYVEIKTTITNEGDKDAKLPLGQFINGSGQVSLLVPGFGFTPDLALQITANVPAIIYAGFDNVDVSYGYFFPSNQFIDPKTSEPYKSTMVSYSGVTGLIIGEEFLKLAPLGSGGQEPEIHTTIPAHGNRTLTGYFVVGNGSAGSVLDAGLDILGAKARPVTGLVTFRDGTPVGGATVAIMLKGQTLITFRTDKNGRITGRLPTGGDIESKRFGGGLYSVMAEMPGYHANGTTNPATCDPEDIDVATKDVIRFECVLGETGIVQIDNPVTETETSLAIAARLTIVGIDPSPNKVGSSGKFKSIIEWDQPFGINDIKYITAKGTIDLTDKNQFNLEPGTYRFVISHGPEYTAYEEVVKIDPSGTFKIKDVKLNRAVKTKGFVNTDFHVHSISSPDSSLPLEMRVLTASAEGMDVLQSSDHDYITDYQNAAQRLMSEGIIPDKSLKTASGDEITPNHYGHLNAFPLVADPNDPEGGPVDWSLSDKKIISPKTDYIWTLDELIQKVRDVPGEKVIQVNHIMDMPSGIPLACGWITTPFYGKDFGVRPFSSYADPVERRMPPATSSSFPLPLGTSGLMTTKFDSIELIIGNGVHEGGQFMRSALPTWFNFLNLGLIVTATADSDSHDSGLNPIGLPRNFVASSIDPRDNLGDDFADIDLNEYAINIRNHHVTVSVGPIIQMSATSESGKAAFIGDAIIGRRIQFTINVNAPSWGWFDSIEIYANTEPIPVDDTTDMPMQGQAANPADFYKPYHIPRYTYEPTRAFRLSDGTLENWKEKDGVISADVTFEMTVNEDTWVVALARGTKNTKGYRSLFPIATKALIKETDVPADVDPANLALTHADPKVGAPGMAFTNPIFVDVDGDGFQSKYVRDGSSPLK